MTVTLAQLAADLAAGRTTSQQLVEECLERIADPDGEGRVAFLEVDADGARTAASAIDALRAAGAEPSPLAGIPVSVKDLFDVRGQVTRAGSRALDRGSAERDAAAVARWRRAGLVIVGRTNMTEFAFSGLGVNPHYGTPATPWERERRRVAGGSSSGAAVSITDGMAYGALGTDTGGSCRIPAALCGIVGFKPTQATTPRGGTIPLSTTLDTVGPLANTVADCALLYELLRGDAGAGGDGAPLAPAPLARPPRLGVARGYFLDGADATVRTAFERALATLRDAGAELVDVDLPELAEIPAASASGGFPAAESYAWHRELIEQRGADYDPRVLSRIMRGASQSAVDRIAVSEWRASFIARVAERLDGLDAFITPTVPLVAPTLEELEDEAEYTRVNLLMLRNPTAVNLLDGCALSLPMHAPGEAPTGLMVAHMAGHDDRLLRVANWIEGTL